MFVSNGVIQDNVEKLIDTQLVKKSLTSMEPKDYYNIHKVSTGTCSEPVLSSVSIRVLLL
jgi:wyosine [tRNA(Phe)-imidazoG37] synthetase (radical SAM superfamily)